MKKEFAMIGVIIIIIISLVIALFNINIKKNNRSIEGISCHRMSNGILMGDCNSSDAKKFPPISANKFIPGEGIDTSKLSAEQPSSIIDLNDGEKINLEANLISKEIFGRKVIMYGYNSQIPGPLFKVKKDSNLTVEFTNNIDLPTTIHWHGIRIENKNDGVPEITQNIVEPGGNFTYSLQFPDQGIFWYHPHYREDIQQDAGLYGNILVYANEQPPVNKEEMLVVDDILLDNERNIIPYGKEVAEYALMGRFGNTFLVNGDTEYSLEINQGDVMRFYITNIANVRPFNISFNGAKIKRIGSDIGNYERESFIDSLVIGPAERYIIDVIFEESGEYKILHSTPSGSSILGKIIAKNKKSSINFSEEFYLLREYKNVIRDIDNFRDFFDKSVDYQISLDITMEGMEMMEGMMGKGEDEIEGMEMMMEGLEKQKDEMEDMELMGKMMNRAGKENGGIEWEDPMEIMNKQINSNDVLWILRDNKSKKENMNVQYQFRVGDKIKIRLVNEQSMHPMQHPIHFHGQRFLVLAENGIKNENLVWKDTVLVPADSYIDILLDISNPGTWVAHCHIPEHMESGMMMHFTVQERIKPL